MGLSLLSLPLLRGLQDHLNGNIKNSLYVLMHKISTNSVSRSLLSTIIKKSLSIVPDQYKSGYSLNFLAGQIQASQVSFSQWTKWLFFLWTHYGPSSTILSPSTLTVHLKPFTYWAQMSPQCKVRAQLKSIRCRSENHVFQISEWTCCVFELHSI